MSASRNPRQGIAARPSGRQIARAWDLMVSVGRPSLDEVLLNWKGREVSSDECYIVQRMPDRWGDQGAGMRAATQRVPKWQFLQWLASDGPFDQGDFGSEIGQQASWVAAVQRLRALSGLDVRAVPGQPSAGPARVHPHDHGQAWRDMSCLAGPELQFALNLWGGYVLSPWAPSATLASRVTSASIPAFFEWLASERARSAAGLTVEGRRKLQLLRAIADVSVTPDTTASLGLRDWLAQWGQSVDGHLEAERAQASGMRVFVFHEMDEEPLEVTSVEVLRRYAADQIMVVPAGLQLPDGGESRGGGEEDGEGDCEEDGPPTQTHRERQR